MSSLLNKSKIFLSKHSHIVDFLSASLIISLCLIILLPKVHDSFQQVSSNSLHHNHNHEIEQINITTSRIGTPSKENSNFDDELISKLEFDEDNLSVPEELEHNRHHHHHHGLPIGELLICVGFFVFYCIGLGLSKTNYTSERQPLLLAKRKINKYYVEEIRITRRPIDDNSTSDANQQQQQQTDTSRNTMDSKWHLSAKVSLFALLLASSLIVFDINVHGLMETIKVFRAAATGALLYLAFFVILPKTPDCNFCTKSDDDLFSARDIFAQEAQ